MGGRIRSRSAASASALEDSLAIGRFLLVRPNLSNACNHLAAPKNGTDAAFKDAAQVSCIVSHIGH